jgi:hypothetical protein
MQSLVCGNPPMTCRVKTDHFTLGMVGIGGLFVMGGGYLPGTIPQALGALSVLLASVNVAGGFVITKRMLDMFKREQAVIGPLVKSDLFLNNRADGSPRILLAIWYTGCRVHGRFFGCRKHRNGWPCSSGLPDQQCTMHRSAFLLKL